MSTAPRAHSRFATARMAAVVVRVCGNGRPERSGRRIDLDVPRACFFGLRRPNGAGKTTMIRMPPLLRPDAGQGVGRRPSTCGRPGRPLRRASACFPTSSASTTRLTGAELLEYCGLLRGMAPGSDARRFGDLLTVLSLDEAANTLVIDYSPGCGKEVAPHPRCCTRRRAVPRPSRSKRSIRLHPHPAHGSTLHRYRQHGGVLEPRDGGRRAVMRSRRRE